MHDHDMTDTGEDAELRVLLQRVVPHLEAPADRMRQVRRRVRRRRRRRAAAAGALAGAGLAFWLATGSPGAPPDAALPAASPPGEADTNVRRFTTASGLTLTLPPGWRALDVPRGDDTAVVYAAVQPLDADRVPAGCGDTTGTVDTFTCAPLTALVRGGALVAFETLDGVTSTPPPRTRLTPDPGPGDVCRSLGGKLQYAALVLPAPHQARSVLRVSICLGEPPATPANPNSHGPSSSPTVDPRRDTAHAFDIQTAPDGTAEAWGDLLDQAEALIGSARHD
ncbi:hypothetical protein ACIBWG_06590 [Streptomyces griseoaurantiacus]|uniref:hypothetical protein n=1 Tax=Streptomyces griseoaurantiacus TaxID=68213 RepID=UPI002ED22490|nr:hypothetical protein OHA67_32355 [Streptomyces jietaisiensis]